MTDRNDVVSEQRRKIDWFSIVLVVGFILVLATSGVELDRVLGLPAHILLVHLPVVLLPIGCIATVVLFAKSSSRYRFGPLLAVAMLVLMSSTLIAKNAGEPLEHHEMDRVRSSAASTPALVAKQRELIHEHADAGERLATVTTIFTFVIVGSVLVDRRLRSRRERDPNFSVGKAIVVTTSVLTILLALGTLGSVVQTGHLGSKAAWELNVDAQDNSRP